MSYTPKHGGQSKPSKPADTVGSIASEKPSEPKRKNLLRIVAVFLLIVFLAGIIVAAIFLFKPTVKKNVPVEETVASTAAVSASVPAETYAQAQAPTVTATTGSHTSSNPVLQYSGGEIPTSGSRHDVTLETDGGADAMAVIGNWHLDKGTAYSFDGYGRGVMITPVENYTFAYSAQNGHLIIDFDVDNGMDSDYTYVIGVDNLGKDILTLKRDDKEYKFTKEEQQ